MDPKQKRPSPLSDSDALGFAREFLHSGSLIPTPHLRKRMSEKNFNIQDVTNVIESGMICKPPEWNEEFKEYRYSIKGKDIEGEDLAIVISISVENQTLTVITGF